MTAELYSDSWLSGEPVYLADMDRCLPSDALSSFPVPGRWRTLEYDADDFSGVMLLGGPETAAPDITYELGVTGWHAVSVGVFPHYDEGSEVLVRLSKEDTFSMLRRVGGEMTVHELTIQPMFWRIADLTDQDMVFGQISYELSAGEGIGSVESPGAQIAYVKLVPLTDAEVEAYKADRAAAKNKRLFAHNDAHGVHYTYKPTTAEHIRRHIEPYRDTDFGKLCWEAAGGDLLQYLGNTGRLSTFDGLEDFGPQGYRKLAESWRTFRDAGVDPFEVALEHTHEIGMEFHAGYRMTGFYYPPPIDYFNYGASFYKYHPELRSIDRDGNAAPRMSYAFPAVREYVLSVFREIAQYDVDGVSLLYNRRPPYVDYDPPIVEGFKQETGRDPREIDDADPEWLSYRARTMTGFMRELREAMEDEARKQGRRKIQISAVVMGSEEENLYNALDLGAWVSEGLIDTLAPYTSKPRLDSMSPSWTDPGDVENWVSMTRGTAASWRSTSCLASRARRTSGAWRRSCTRRAASSSSSGTATSGAPTSPGRTTRCGAWVTRTTSWPGAAPASQTCPRPARRCAGLATGTCTTRRPGRRQTWVRQLTAGQRVLGEARIPERPERVPAGRRTCRATRCPGGGGPWSTGLRGSPA